MALIEVDKLSKRYEIKSFSRAADTLKEAVSTGLTRFFSGEKATEESFWALKDITFTVEQGDRLGIIGANGAGKSTLLKILSRIVAPTAGKVCYRGRMASLLEVGTGFHPELSGRENIYLNGAILGMVKKEIERHFDAIVDFAGVAPFLDMPVKRYSSGMFARLGFSIAAHLDPDILIVDEVLSVGDLAFQEKCLKKLDSLSLAGKTILFVSHNISAIIALCNKGLFLQKGRTAAFGTIDECLTAYYKDATSSQLAWEGDIGDHRLRLKKFALEGLPSGRSYSLQGDELTLLMLIDVIEATEDLIVGYDLYSRHGYPLASARTSEDPHLHKSLRQVGRHAVEFKLPTLLLRQGDYRLSALCLVHNDRNIVEDKVLLELAVHAPPGDIRFSHPHRGPGLFLSEINRKENGTHTALLP